MESVAVIGMGYVGIPVAAIIAKSGKRTIGIDVDEGKVESINSAIYPIEGKEPGIQDLIEEVVSSGVLTCTTNYREAANVDVWIVCVETPFDVRNFEPNLSSLKSAVSDIGKNMKKGCMVIVESTIPPGTMENSVIKWLEDNSGLKAGDDFGVGHCPERVMPGKLIENLSSYGRALGCLDENSHNIMREIYGRITRGELAKVDLRTAEVVKTFENTYRDAEIAIANDFAKYCDSVNVDFFSVRELVNTVESRNLHLPGGGVGGHCIPKDTWLLAYGSKDFYTPEFLIKSREVNDSMPAYVCELLLFAFQKLGIEKEKSTVAILGLSYLEESDDVRNSPTVDLLKELEKWGISYRIHDSYVSDMEHIPLYQNLEDALIGVDAVIAMVAHGEYKELDLLELRNILRTPLVIDSRNIFEITELIKAGLEYCSLGRGNSWGISMQEKENDGK